MRKNLGIIGSAGAGLKNAIMSRMLSINITAEAQVIDEAYIEKYVDPVLTDEYKDNKEGFLIHLPKVPAAAIGKGGIYKNVLIDNTEVVINNTVDFTAPIIADKKHLFLPWDTVDTKPAKITRSELRGLTYGLESAVKDRQLKKIMRKTRDKLLHEVAPDGDTAETPVVELTGGVMSYAALATMAEKLGTMNVDLEDCIVVFSTKHVLDLQLEQGVGKAFREIMVSERTAALNDFAGFPNMYKSTKVPYYDNTGAKKALDSIVTGTDRQATIIIHAPEVAFHREKLEMFHKPRKTDTRSADPGDEFRLGGYFVADTVVNMGFAAMY